MVNSKAGPSLLLSAALVLAAPYAAAQEVAEIPFWHTPEGTAALGGGLRSQEAGVGGVQGGALRHPLSPG